MSRVFTQTLKKKKNPLVRGGVAGGLGEDGALLRDQRRGVLRPLLYLLSLGTYPGSAASRKDSFASNQSSYLVVSIWDREVNVHSVGGNDPQDPEGWL